MQTASCCQVPITRVATRPSCARKGSTTRSWHMPCATVPTLNSVFDGLADFIDTHFDAGVLRSLIV